MKKKPAKLSSFRKSGKILPDEKEDRYLMMLATSNTRAAEFKQSHDKEKSESDK